MPIVTKKTSGNFTFMGTNLTADVGLDLDWDLSKTILLFNLSTPTNTAYQSAMVTGKLIEGTGYKSIRFERYSCASSLDLQIDYQVIQLNTASVQRGSVTFVSGDTTKNVTINTVDLTKSFVLLTVRTSDSATSARYSIKADISTTTNLRLVRQVSGGTANIVEWQVVSLSDLSTLQQKSGSFTYQGEVNIAITSVDLTRTILIGSFNYNLDITEVTWRQWRLTSATNLRIEMNVSSQTGGTVYYHIYVLEFATGAAIVQRAFATIADTSLSKTETLTNCDVAKSLVILNNAYNRMGLAPSAVYNSGHHLVRVSSFAATSLVLTRGLTGNAVYVPYEVITFPLIETVNKKLIHLNNMRRRQG